MPNNISVPLTTKQAAAPVVAIAQTQLRAPSLGDVQIEGGFWGRLQHLNREASIPHEVKWLEKFGVLNNFDAVADGTVAKRRVGRQFADTDAYKVIEALTWEIAREPSAELNQDVADIVARILPALEADGYIGTRYGHEGLAPRYTNMEWGHELYNFGHLIQAGVARIRTGHGVDDPFVDLTLKVADHVCETFGPDGLQLVCGHPEIEPALVELYRATGEKKYLDQAELFIERRGHKTLRDIEFGRTYFQDETPVREMEVLEGHSVRALYLAAGAIDLAVENEDEDLVATVEKQYRNTLARRTYITGGMGSHHQDEAFGADFELPPDRAYCETCAGIASIMVAWRLILSTGKLEYGDIIERTLYNILATAVSEDGKSFFYANPLQQRVPTVATDPEEWSPRASNAQRSSWFEVSCCPPNLSRTLAQLSTYFATTSATGAQLIQYGSADLNLETGVGPVTLKMRTDYPYDQEIRVEVETAPTTWDLELRVPVWAEGASLSVNGEVRAAAAPSVSIANLKAGDVVVLTLPNDPRFTFPDPRIDAVRGCVAVESGPFVMCLESVFQVEGADVSQFSVDTSVPLEGDGSRVLASGVRTVQTDETWPYASSPSPSSSSSSSSSLSLPEEAKSENVNLVFTPYWDWANHGSTTMRIWVPQAN